MAGLGTIINALGIILGGLGGLLFGKLIPRRCQDSLSTVCGVSVLFIGIGGAMQGWLLVGCKPWERPVLMLGGLTLIYPGTMTDLVGFALLAVVALLQLVRRRPRSGSVRNT